MSSKISGPWVPARNEGRIKLAERFDKLAIESKVSVSRSVVEHSAKPLVVPIYHSSTYVFDSVAEFSSPNHGGNYVYQRCGNPTQETAETIICELEGGAATLVYNSGLAAVSAVLLQFLSAGDHLIVQKPLYTGSYLFIKETLTRFGVAVSWINVGPNFEQQVAATINDRTKLIYVETPVNPVMVMIDVEAICRIGHDRNVMVAFDCTFASPYLIQPISQFGADIVLHSCSKYIGGHSDLIGGCVTTKTEDNWLKLKRQQLTTGSTMAPFVASLVIRGLKTLPLRVMKQSQSALRIAEYLEQHPKVKRVHYPGLKSHPSHEIAKKQMRHFGGMIAFDVGSWNAAITVVKAVKLIVLAVSLGATESLIEHCASMTHSRELIQIENGHKDSWAAITDGLIRLSVGLEDTADLLDDLSQALDAISAVEE